MMSNDEVMLKKVCCEMGITWDDTLDAAVIDGEPANKFFAKNTIFPKKSDGHFTFDLHQNCGQKDDCLYRCNYTFAA